MPADQERPGGTCVEKLPNANGFRCAILEVHPASNAGKKPGAFGRDGSISEHSRHHDTMIIALLTRRRRHEARGELRDLRIFGERPEYLGQPIRQAVLLAEQFTRLKSYVETGTATLRSRRSRVIVSKARTRSKIASLVTHCATGVDRTRGTWPAKHRASSFYRPRESEPQERLRSRGSAATQARFGYANSRANVWL